MIILLLFLWIFIDIFIAASSEDQTENVKKLEKAVEELRQLLQESSEQYGCLEASKKKMEEEYVDKLESSNAANLELKSELEKVNTLLEANTKKGVCKYFLFYKI